MVEMLLTMGEMTALTLAIGTSGAFVSSLLQAPIWLQLSIWAGSSLLALLFLRPFLRRYFTPRESDFTVQSFAGQFGKVLEVIEPHQKGRVQINGETWFAVVIGRFQTKEDALEYKTKLLERYAHIGNSRDLAEAFVLALESNHETTNMSNQNAKG